jgi:uncharacterized protein (TIGR02569 family)
MANMDTVLTEVIKAFKCSGDPQKLEGGQGRSYRVGELVFKPVDDIVRYEWVAELLTHIQCSEIRIAMPQRTESGEFTYLGWGATQFEPGEETHGRWPEKLAVCRALHHSLQRVQIAPLPPGSDPWTRAHQIAWQETAMPQTVHPETRQMLAPLFQAYEPMTRSSGLIHSDMCGNILFAAGMKPLIIDFSAANGDQEYAEAILVADAIAWEKAPVELINELSATPVYRQLLLRAVTFRVITVALRFPNKPEWAEFEYNSFVPIVQWKFKLSGCAGEARRYQDKYDQTLPGY